MAYTEICQVNAAGRMSDDKRNEGQLLCDVLGLESLVDEITYKLASDAVDEPTATAILGPFYRHDAPQLPMGSCIVSSLPKEVADQGDRTWMHGTVTDFRTGRPIERAVVDVWHTAPNGLYEQQDPDQPEMNLRGRFTTGKDGKYDFYCLRPVPYPIPFDGPAGKVLQALDRHPMRPAHIHFIVGLHLQRRHARGETRNPSDASTNMPTQLTAPNYKPIVTQIFDRKSKYINDDAVFAVKDSLIVDFIPFQGDPNAEFELPYDFKLASFDDAEAHPSS